MSLSNIGKIVKASKNVDDLSDVLKNFGKYENALDILGKIKNIDTSIKADALSKAFGIDTAKTAADLASIGSATSGLSGLSGAFASAKAAGVGLLTVLKSIAPVLAGIGVAIAAFKGFQWLDDKFTLTKGTADKHYEESIKKYTQAQSDLQTLQSQYESNQERIYELRAKQNRSQSDNALLNQLQDENKLLMTQLDIKEKLVSNTQKQTALDADTKLNKSGIISNENMFDEATRLMSEVKTTKQRIRDLYAAQKDASQETPLIGKSEYDLYQKQIDAYEKNLIEKESDLSEAMSEIFNTSQSFWDENGNLINKSTKDTANKVENLINDYEELSGSAEYTSDKIHNMFSKAKFDGIEDNLISIAKTSGRDSLMNKISEVEGLSEAMQNASIDAETLANYIMSIADPEAKDMSGIKQNLNDMFGDIETDDMQGPLLNSNKFTLANFLNSQKDSELETFWNYLTANNYDGSNWSLTDLISNWNKAQEQAKKELQNNPISLTDLLDKGETTPTSIQDITDQFQSNISSIKSAMDSLKSGEFKDSDITDLIQQFPELASETDNLEQGLSKLTLTKLGDAISGIRKETSQITDPTKKKEAEDYIQRLIDSVDLSNVSFDNIQSEISKNIMASGPDNGIRSGIMNQLFGKYSGDEAGMLAMLKLSVDPSMADASLYEWISKIESLRPQIEIDAHVQNISDIKKELVNAQQKQTRHNNRIEYKQAQGYSLTESDYDTQISDIRKQIGINERLKNETALELNSIIKDGATKDSDKYQNVLSEYEGYANTIADSRKQIVELEKSKQMLPITNLQNQLSYLQNSADLLQKNIDLKKASNELITQEDYKSLIQSGNDQISNLEETNKQLKILRDNSGLSETDTGYKEFQDQINANVLAIENAKQQQLEWNKSMQNLPVTYAKELSSAMSSAMSEIQSSTGLTSDTIDTLRTQFSDLENVDISDLFYNSAKGAKVNTSVLKDLVEQQNKIQSGKFADEINRQRQAIQQYQDMIGKNNTNSTLEAMQSNLEGLLQRQAQYFAEYQNQLSQLSQFQAIQDAKNTENPGSHYDQIISDVKAAKKAYDNDLVGTDDFKTVAEYLSPNGFADAANFNENYAKAKRYLTEDSSKGILNFLSDLKKKGYATYETLSNGVKQWSVNITDAKKAAYDMGMGEEFFTDVYNKLGDYGFATTSVNSLEEGSLKLEEANTNLVDAYVKLAEMQSSGAPTYAIEQQKQVISELEAQVQSVTDSTEQFKKASAQSYAEGLSGLKDQIDFLEKIRKETDNKQVAEGIETAIKNLANEYGVTLDYDQNGGISLNETSYSDALSKYQIGSFKTPLTAEQMGIGIEEAVNFESTKNAIIEQKDALQDYFSVLQQYSQEDLSGIQLSNGAYEVEGEMKSAEDALQGIADKLGLSKEQATQLVSALTALGVIKPKVDVKDIQNGIDKLHELQESGEINTTINFDADITEMSNDELADRFNELMVIKAGLEVDTDEYDAVCALIEQTQVQMHINTVLESTNGDVESALGMTDEEIALECGINVNDNGAQEKIDSIRSGLEEIEKGASSSVTVRMADDQFNQLIGSKETTTITVDANNEPAKAKIDEAVEYGNSQTAEMTVKANTAPAISSASFAVHQINTMQASVNVNANTGGLVGQVQSALSSTSFKVNVSVGLPTKRFTGTAFSPASTPAHAYGNAYNVINYKNAYADGKVGLKQDETALVNELGQESIIRDDKWLLLPPGMHTQSLKKGDIVLNHLQTRDLIKHGKAFGHGKAYANGTATDGMSAYASLNATGQLGHNKYTGTATGTGSAAVKDNTKALNKNTDSNNDNTDSNNKTGDALDELIKKLNENIKDWIEISLDRADRLVEKYKSIADNYGGYTKTDNNLVRAIDAIDKSISSLEKAQKRYEEKAAEVANELGLDNTTLEKIHNGTIDIESVSEDQKKKIEAYETWYSKILDCTEAIRDKQQEKKEVAEQRVQNVLDSYDIIIGKREAAANLAESNQNLRVLQWKNQKLGTEYYKQMEKQLKYTEEQATLKDKEIKEYSKQMKNYLKENGNNKKDPVYQTMTKQLIELNNESVELQIAAEELKDKLQETKEQVLEWRFDRWDRAGQKQDAVINYKLITDEKDFQIKEKDYTERMKTTNSQINALKALRDEKYKDYLQHVTTQNNEQAQAALEELAKLDVQIMQLGTDMEELKNKIMELRWEPFYEAQDQLKGVISEYDTLRQLIGDEANFNDDGSFTVQGTTNLLLLQESIDATKVQIANYRQQLDNLEEQYRNKCFGPEEYLEKTKELQEGIRSAATSMESYKQTMLDMYSTQIEMENDLLQNNIDKRLEALDAKEKYYDYDKTLKKKNKDINVLKAQIAALEGTKLSISI